MPKTDSPAAPTLEKRLEALEDERAIINILYRYASTFDYSRPDELLALFTEDAVLEIRPAKGGNVRRFEGAALQKFFKDRPSSPLPTSKHLVTAPLINVDGSTATSECYLAVLSARPEGTAVGTFGRYEDRLIKRNGRWLLKERIIHSEA